MNISRWIACAKRPKGHNILSVSGREVGIPDKWLGQVYSPADFFNSIVISYP